MSFGRKLRTEKHHWWPKGLSQYWASSTDGRVTRVMWNGESIRLEPHKFATIRNAHHLKHSEDSPWNATFEPAFNKADSAFPTLVKWLLELRPKRCRPNATFADRFTGCDLSKEQRADLAETMASLIVRSPRSRNNIKITVESYVGLKDYVDKKLTAANMFHQQPAFSRAINNGGKFVALITEGHEFIFGDGFLHNFPITADRPMSAHFVIPVLPTVTMAYCQPLMYRPKPDLVMMSVSDNEVAFLNDVVQVYSRDQIFYRRDAPRVFDAFVRREHMQIGYNNHEWLERVFECAAEFYEPKSGGPTSAD